MTPRGPPRLTCVTPTNFFFLPQEKFKKSWLYEELFKARNVKPSFSWGLILGIIFTGIDQILFRGKLPFTLKHKHADHESLKPANEMPKIEYPKPDNIITFDKTKELTFVNLVKVLLRFFMLN